MSSKSGDKLRDSWVANAPAWCDAVREGRIESRRAVTDAAIVAAVLDQHPRRVLDVGCGEGWLARTLAAQGIDVTGIDASAPLIEAAQSLGGATFYVASYDDLSIAGKDYDLAVANFSILDDRAEDLFRALSPLGLIVQTVHPAFVDGPYIDGWRTETFAAIPGEWREPMPWYFRTIASWHRAFTSAGYTVDEIREPMAAEGGRATSMIFVCRVQ